MRMIDADAFKKKFSGQYEFMKRVIDDEPTVDNVAHGEWIDNDYDFPICSTCRNEAIFEHGIGYYLSSYCPACGAKMIRKCIH